MMARRLPFQLALAGLIVANVATISRCEDADSKAVKAFLSDIQPQITLSFENGLDEKQGEKYLFRDEKKVEIAFGQTLKVAKGISGKGVAFGGKDSAIYLRTKLRDSRIVAFWVKPTALDSPFYLLSFHGSREGIGVASFTGDDKMSFAWFSKGKWPNVNFEHKLTVGKWDHVAFVFDWERDTFAYFLNGVHQDSRKIEPRPSNLDASLAISNSFMDQAFEGDVDEVIVSETIPQPILKAMAISSQSSPRGKPNPARVAGTATSGKASSASELLELAYSIAMKDGEPPKRALTLQEIAISMMRAKQYARAKKVIELAQDSQFEVRKEVALAAASSGDIAFVAEIVGELKGNSKAQVLASLSVAQVKASKKQLAMVSLQAAENALDENGFDLPFAAEELAYAFAFLGDHRKGQALQEKQTDGTVSILARVVEGLAETNRIGEAERLLPQLEGRLPMGVAAEALVKTYCSRKEYNKAIQVINKIPGGMGTRNRIRAIGTLALAYRATGEIKAGQRVLRDALPESLNEREKLMFLDEVVDTSCEAGYIDDASQLFAEMSAADGRYLQVRKQWPGGFVFSAAQLCIAEAKRGRTVIAGEVLQHAIEEVGRVPADESLPLRRLGYACTYTLNKRQAMEFCSRQPPSVQVELLLGMAESPKAKSGGW